MCCCCQNSNVLLISSSPGWAVPRRREENFLFVGQAREMASNCRPSLQQAAGASVQLSSLPPKQRGGRRGRKEKDLFLPQTNKQTNKGGLGLAVSCPLGLLICSVCLLAVILIVAFCALIWIRLVVIILLLHLLAGDIESNN